MICVRVRCKNCNGWSAWSDRGYVLKRGGDAQWEDEVYVWLFHHSLEQYYGVMTQFGVKSKEGEGSNFWFKLKTADEAPETK